MLDPRATVRVADQTSSTLAQSDIQVMIPFSSLASQAVGPPLSNIEMQFAGRIFSDIADKLLKPLPAGPIPTATEFRPLDRQAVSTTDSVLGPHTSGFGLNISYIDLIKDVFQPKFWNDGSVNPDGTGNKTLMKRNFALFFGLAVQAYEATLIPDRTPVDALLAALNGTPPSATTTTSRVPGIDPAIERGLAVFLSGRASCSLCHAGSEMTSASVSHLTGFGDPAALVVAGVPAPVVALAERMVMGDGSKAAYDTGFYNIGVRPTRDDLSIFERFTKPQDSTLSFPLNLALDVPFSFGMLAQDILRGTQPAVNSLLLSGKLNLPKSPGDLSPVPFAITVACAPGGRGQALGVVNGNGCRPLNTNEHIAIRGSFKTPGLRNLKFTGPYFHNGLASTIEQVVEFYNQGGRFNLAFNPDGCKNNNKNCIIGQVDFDAEITAGVIRPEEVKDLITFLEDGLTDIRVAEESRPFDHPQLCLPNGTLGLKDLPAVGTDGHPGQSILTFQDTLEGKTGPHDMQTPCKMNPDPTTNYLP